MKNKLRIQLALDKGAGHFRPRMKSKCVETRTVGCEQYRVAHKAGCLSVRQSDPNTSNQQSAEMFTLRSQISVKLRVDTVFHRKQHTKQPKGISALYPYAGQRKGSITPSCTCAIRIAEQSPRLLLNMKQNNLLLPSSSSSSSSISLDLSQAQMDHSV